jgi:hypothetical protein
MAWNLGVYGAHFLGTYSLPLGVTTITTGSLNKGNMSIPVGATLDIAGTTFVEGITVINGTVTDSTAGYSQININDRDGQTIVNGNIRQINTINIYTDKNLIFNTTTLGASNVSSINIQPGGTLTLSGLQTMGANVFINGEGTVIKGGSGTLTFNSPNSIPKRVSGLSLP